MTIIDRLAHTAGVSIRRKKPLLSSLLWPDLILVTGGRRVIDALRIKAMSERRSRLICVGRPWSDLDLFDLVITTPQYRLPARPNVLTNTTPLNQPDRDALSISAEDWRDEINHLPKPWIAMLVGGNCGSCRFTAETGQRLAAEANDLAKRTGGSLLISTSGRTPKAATHALLEDIDASHAAFRFDKQAGRNPHLGFRPSPIVSSSQATAPRRRLSPSACTTDRQRPLGSSTRHEGLSRKPRRKRLCPRREDA